MARPLFYPPSLLQSKVVANVFSFSNCMNSNLGPQTSLPVPEGILNHRGKNTVALPLWAFDEGGAKLDGLSLKADGVVETSMKEVESVPQPSWRKRDGAY